MALGLAVDGALNINQHPVSCSGWVTDYRCTLCKQLLQMVPRYEEAVMMGPGEPGGLPKVGAGIPDALFHGHGMTL